MYSKAKFIRGKSSFLAEALRLFGSAIKSGCDLICGLFFIGQLKDPIITIFAGKGGQGRYADQAEKIAALCIQHHFSVLTGGGPGLMQAANCGAANQAREIGRSAICTLGVGVKGVDIAYRNLCSKTFVVSHFSIRKLLLIRYSAGFIVLPGGLGTVDELFELLNLRKLDRVAEAPIILIGVSYWQPLVTWFHQALAQEFVASRFKDIFVVTDDLDYAVSLLVVSVRSSDHQSANKRQ